MAFTFPFAFVTPHSVSFAHFPIKSYAAGKATQGKPFFHTHIHTLPLLISYTNMEERRSAGISSPLLITKCASEIGYEEKVVVKCSCLVDSRSSVGGSALV